MVQERDWIDDVEQVCLELTPPLLLASASSWKYPQSGSDEHQKEAASRVGVISHWVEEEVPRLLRRLHDLLDDQPISALEQPEFRLKARIAVAAAIYVNPRKEPDVSDEAQVGREPWTNAENRALAMRILRHRFLSLNKEAGLDYVIITHLLVEYLKPIFRSTPSRSINSSTGRVAKDNPNLAKGTAEMSSSTAMDDEIMWKGGDVQESIKTFVLGSKVVIDMECSTAILQQRHRALGCYNVLFVCCTSLLAAQQDGQSSSWEDNWPLILPPLLALLEDSSPLYRLIGSRILATTILSSSADSSVVGTLLLRTGVATLFRQRLESNLTFITTQLSAALLQSSAEALILLSQKTTVDLWSTLRAPLNAAQDGGKGRFEQLSKLLDEGVIRVWAYAPNSTSTIELDDLTKSTKETLDDDREASDIVNTSINVLTRLAQKDALGLGIARYLDLTLEFLTAQLIGLETRLDRHKKTEQSKLTLEREICSSRAIKALLIICERAPGVEKWSSRCLDAVARCWLLLQDQTDQKQVQILFQYLQDIIKALANAHPILMKQQLQKLVELDGSSFASLLAISSP